MNRYRTFLLILLMLIVPLGVVGEVPVPSHDVVISQIYGGGGNTGATYKHDFIELFNRGTAVVDLTGWSVQYASATGSTWQVTVLSGSLAPGQYYLIQQAQGAGGTLDLPLPDRVGGIPLSATSGKVALVISPRALNGACPQGGQIRDLVGYGSANCFETSPAPLLSNATAALRREKGCTDTNNNAADFSVGPPQLRSTASPFQSCAKTLHPTGTGAAQPDLIPVSGTTLLTVTVTPGMHPVSTGISVTCDLTPLGGSAEHILSDDGAGGDRVAGDLTFSTLASITASAPQSMNTLSCRIRDAEHRTGEASVSVRVILPIGTVQGVVGDSADGPTVASPYAGRSVIVQGVIYQKTLAQTNAGEVNHGFFLQNTAATADGDAATSDGIFVFLGRFTDLIGGYVPVVGDEIILQGTVTEFFGLTELTNSQALAVVRRGVDIDAEIPTFDVNPPAQQADAQRYWERREGMRGRVPAGSIVVSGRDVFSRTRDAEVWVIRPDSVPALRRDFSARRIFRDPHPLDDIPDTLFDNGNGFRILLGSLGIKAASGDLAAMIAPARTFDTVTSAPTGGVYYSFGKYAVQPDSRLALREGTDPSLLAPPQAIDRAGEYSIAVYNVENLYDYRDDPFDGCDFPGNAGCPGVQPPFDYLPASEGAYQAKLRELASQIVHDLHGPDVIMVQEAEDQDICTVTGGILLCGARDSADGKPDTLQELAVVIARQYGIEYDAVYDRDGADRRGIVTGFLYRTDRTELLPAEADHPVLGSDPQIVYPSSGLPSNRDVENPKALNAVLPADVDRSSGVDGENVFTRPPLTGRFRIWRDSIGRSVFTDLYLINNHYSSTPTARVGQRREQANYTAALVEALRAGSPTVRVVVGGDLNVFPRPDDPFAPGDPRFPSDQLAGLYGAGLTNLWDILVADAPAAAYSYVFQGQAQTLDHLFVTPSQMADVVQMRAAHINSDWPQEHDADGPRGASDHDPLVARFSIAPTVDRLEALVGHYAGQGMIIGRNTHALLAERLEQARRFRDEGRIGAFIGQVQAFRAQVEAFSPRRITPQASDALSREAALLLQQTRPSAGQ